MLGIWNGVHKTSYASYDDAWIGYIYSLFGTAIYVILNEKLKIYKGCIRSAM